MNDFDTVLQRLRPIVARGSSKNRDDRNADLVQAGRLIAATALADPRPAEQAFGQRLRQLVDRLDASRAKEWPVDGELDLVAKIETMIRTGPTTVTALAAGATPAGVSEPTLQRHGREQAEDARRDSVNLSGRIRRASARAAQAAFAAKRSGDPDIVSYGHRLDDADRALTMSARTSGEADPVSLKALHLVEQLLRDLSRKEVTAAMLRPRTDAASPVF